MSYIGCHYIYFVADIKRVNFRITFTYLAYSRGVRLHTLTLARLSRAAHLTSRLYCVIATVKTACSYAALIKIEATSARMRNVLTDANTSER